MMSLRDPVMDIGHTSCCSKSEIIFINCTYCLQIILKVFLTQSTQKTGHRRRHWYLGNLSVLSCVNTRVDNLLRVGILIFGQLLDLCLLQTHGQCSTEEHQKNLEGAPKMLEKQDQNIEESSIKMDRLFKKGQCQLHKIFFDFIQE